MTPNLRSVEEVAEVFEETWSDFIGDIEFNDAFKHLADDPDVPFVLPEMCKWLRTTLTTDRAHIAAVLIAGLEGKRRPMKESMYGTFAYTPTDYNFNQALDTAIALIKATLDVTSEEK